MSLLPAHFLFRMTHPCRYVEQMPDEEAARPLNLPEACRIENFPELGDKKNFADVRLAWNELGLGFQVHIKGKEQLPIGDAARPRSSDGAMLWIDTRDARTSHRASRYCHHFFFMPSGGGPQKDEPAVGQLKIHRALVDAPLCTAEQILFRSERTKTGYRLEAFLPVGVLHGYDPETNPRLGFYWWIRDAELGEQTLGIGAEFPFWEDPSLWSTLELTR